MLIFLIPFQDAKSPGGNTMAQIRKKLSNKQVQQREQQREQLKTVDKKIWEIKKEREAENNERVTEELPSPIQINDIIIIPPPSVPLAEISNNVTNIVQKEQIEKFYFPFGKPRPQVRFANINYSL
jgi:hypothetical protein